MTSVDKCKYHDPRSFHGFVACRRTQSARISLSETSARPTQETLEEQCKCDVMQPGLYDIETEMCTPELDDAKQFIPPEIQNNILDKTPISMFITVYLMDMPTNPNESYLSAVSFEDVIYALALLQH